MNFMQEALRQAKIAFQKDEVPVGAVIVENGKIISATFNQNRALNDPSAHAEILALRQACEIKKVHRLDNCDIYVTLEPCSMCASAIALAKIKRIYYSIPDKKFGAIENGLKVFHNSNCFHIPEIYSGFLEEESKKLLVDFFKPKREKCST